MSSGPGDIEQGLHISVEGTDDGASETFRNVLSAYDAAARAATETNETAARAAEDASRRISSALDGQAVSMREVDELRARVAAGLQQSASSVDQQTAASVKYVEQVQREIAALRELERQGQITAEQRLESTRDLALKVPQSRGDELLSRDSIRTNALAPNADQDSIARYRALIAVDKEVEVAERDLTTTMTIAARDQAAAIRDGVRLGQISREEEGQQLRELLKEYESYADARMAIEKRITENSIAQNKEQAKAQRERQSGVGDFALNAGYLLPGQAGNALTNLGYFAQDGPGMLAVGGAAVLGIGAVAGLADAAKTAGEAEEAMKRLRIAVNDQGESWTELSGKVEAFVEAQERSTIFGRDQTVPAINTLVEAGVKLRDALDIVRVAEDASAATGKPLQTVIEGLQHAYEGNARSLISLGLINKNEAKDGTIQFGDALVLVEQRMRNQATETDTYIDKQKQLGNQFDELKKKIGDLVTPAALASVKALNDELGAINDLAAMKKDDRDAILSASPIFGQGTVDPVSGFDTIARSFDGITKSINSAAEAFKNFLIVKGQASGLDLSSALNAPAAPAAGSQYSNTIDKYAQQYGISPSLASALFGQESSFRPGATSTAGALGLGQLMPGTAKDLGVTNPLDPEQNIRGSLQYLSQLLKEFNGNIQLALTAYNAGPGNVEKYGLNARFLPGADPNYAAKILGQAGPVADNAAPSDAQLRGIRGSAQIGPGAQQSELSQLRAKYLDEEREGIVSWRTDYENALKAIADDESKNAKERVQAELQYDALVKQDKAEQTREDSAAARAAETNYQLQKNRILDLARSGKESRDQEIAALEQLRTAREAQGGPDEARDVEQLTAKIEQLQNAFASTLAQLGKTYKETDESLDDYIAKVRELERGASATQKQVADAAINSAIESAANKSIADIKTAFDNAVKNGLSRPDQEAAARSALSQLGSVRNYGNATAQDAVTTARAGYDSDLGTDYAQDATAAIAQLADKYKEFFADINDGTASSVQKDQQQLALYQQQITELETLAATYKATYGTEATDAVQKLQTAVEDLAVKQHDLTDQTARDERKALADRAAQYQQFTQSAEQHLMSLFDNGKKGIVDFENVYKTVIKQLENDALNSAFKSMFGGGDGSALGGFNPINSIETALLGGVAPSGYFSSILGGGSGAGGSSPNTALMTSAYTKIAASTKGTVDDPHIVAFAPGVNLGPGGSSPFNVGNAASSYGILGAILGPAAGGVVSQIPTSSGIGGVLLGTSFSTIATEAASNTSSSSTGAPGGSYGGGLSAIGLGGAFASLLGSGASGSGSYPYSLSGGDSGGSFVTQSLLSSIIGGGSTNGTSPGSVGTSGSGSILSRLFGGGGYGGYSDGSPVPAGEDSSSYTGEFTSGGSLFSKSNGAANTLSYATNGLDLLQGLLPGGTFAQTAGGALGIAGTVLGGPIGGAIGNFVGTTIGGLFGPHLNASNAPDIYDTKNYGNDIASLIGKQAGANGQTFLPSAQLLGATNNLGEIDYIEELLSKGQTAFIDSTGLTAAQYNTALGFFGSSATGSGTLQHGKNIGQLTVSGASGDGTTLSYTAAQALAAQILQGQQSGGSLGLPGTYTISRSTPDYNIGTVNASVLPAIAQAAATITGTAPGYGTTTGVANPTISTATGQPIVSVNGGTTAQLGGGTTSGNVTVDARGATFAGVGGISDLADMINLAMQRKASGTLPSRQQGYRIRPKTI